MTTTIAVSTQTPTIVCPAWCTVSYAEHLRDLPNLEGFVIHHSGDRNGVHHSRAAYIDNTPDPSDPPLVFVSRNTAEGMTLDAAEAHALNILAVVQEARA